MSRRKKRHGRRRPGANNPPKDRAKAPATEPEGQGNPAKVGRPTKFTEAVKGRILEFIKQGNYRKTAALAAGVSQSLFQEWLALGRRGDPGFLEFLEQVEGAEAEAESTLSLVAWNGAKCDPKVAMDLLGRRWPSRWGRTRVEVTGADHGPLEIQQVTESDILRRFGTRQLERLHELSAEADELKAEAMGDQGAAEGE